MSDRIIINTTINGEPLEFMADTRDSLLDALRDRIGLTGAKEGCNNGSCGACSVIMDGRLVNSCCVLAAEVEGNAAAVAERANVAALMADSAVGENTRVQFVPVQRDDVHDLDGLDRLRALLFS